MVRSSIVAIRQRGRRSRVGPTVIVTGADTIWVAVRCAVTSEATVTLGCRATIGNATGRRESDESDSTSSAFAPTRSRLRPAEPEAIVMCRPRRTSLALRSGIATAREIDASSESRPGS